MSETWPNTLFFLTEKGNPEGFNFVAGFVSKINKTEIFAIYANNPEKPIRIEKVQNTYNNAYFGTGYTTIEDALDAAIRKAQEKVDTLTRWRSGITK